MANEKEIVKVYVPKKKRASVIKKPTPPKLKLLITIVNREKSDIFTAFLESFDINMQLVVAGQGTATTEMMRFLGYSDNKKAIIISVIREDRANAALQFLNEKFKTIKNGKGIAFTVPMTSTIGVAIYQFLSNTLK
jgi:nitrogen regulatory protein PII